MSRYIFYVRACQSDPTLPVGNHKQNPRVVVTILTANAVIITYYDISASLAFGLIIFCFQWIGWYINLVGH